MSMIELASLFDETLFGHPGNGDSLATIKAKHGLPGCWRPTATSIQSIENRLQLKLPLSLIEFACVSNAYPDWFLSLGEDITKPGHIVTVTNYTKRIRRRHGGRWRYIKPRSLIPITVGYDDEYHCLDVARPGPLEGEFEMCYWSAPMTEGIAYELDFPSYLLRIILFWSGNRRGQKKERNARLYGRAKTLLQEHEQKILAALDSNTSQ